MELISGQHVPLSVRLAQSLEQCTLHEIYQIDVFSIGERRQFGVFELALLNVRPHQVTHPQTLAAAKIDA